jgi:hypothetical protein
MLEWIASMFDLASKIRLFHFSVCPQRFSLPIYLPRPTLELNIVFFFSNSIWLIHLEFEGDVGDTYVVYFPFVVSPL